MSAAKNPGRPQDCACAFTRMTEILRGAQILRARSVDSVQAVSGAGQDRLHLAEVGALDELRDEGESANGIVWGVGRTEGEPAVVQARPNDHLAGVLEQHSHQRVPIANRRYLGLA